MIAAVNPINGSTFKKQVEQFCECVEIGRVNKKSKNSESVVFI